MIGIVMDLFLEEREHHDGRGTVVFQPTDAIEVCDDGPADAKSGFLRVRPRSERDALDSTVVRRHVVCHRAVML